MLNPQNTILFIPFYPFRIHTVPHPFFVAMYNYHPLRLAKSNIPKQNFSLGVNDICDGSPSRIRIVRRISLGITTLPRSSIRLTIPVAFIYKFLLLILFLTLLVSAGGYFLCEFCFRGILAGLEKSKTSLHRLFDPTSPISIIPLRVPASGSTAARAALTASPATWT